MAILSNQDLIRRVPLFAALTPRQAEVVAASLSKRRFRRGETLIEQGKRNDTLYILLNGRVRVIKTDEKGREVIIATMGQGEHAGEMSLIDHEPASATVSAEVTSDVLVLTKEAFAACLPEPGSVASALLVGAVQRLRQAGNKSESLALMDVYGRVAHTLLEQSEEQPDGRHVIHNKVTRQDLAKMVGASREMVSRVMKDLEERGFIVPDAEHGLIVKLELHSILT